MKGLGQQTEEDGKDEDILKGINQLLNLVGDLKLNGIEIKTELHEIKTRLLKLEKEEKIEEIKKL